MRAITKNLKAAINNLTETSNGNEYSYCPNCGNNSWDWLKLGEIAPQLLAGERSLEIVISQCQECETIIMSVYEDEPID